MPGTWRDLIRILDPAPSPDDVPVRRRSTPVAPPGEAQPDAEVPGALHDVSIEPLALLAAALGDVPHACAVLDDQGVVIHVSEMPAGAAFVRGWVRGARLVEPGPVADDLRAGRPVLAAGEGEEDLLVPLATRGSAVFGALALACNPAQLPRTSAATIFATARTIALAVQVAQLRGYNERVLGTVGHELRQPLSALVMALDLVAKTTADVPTHALKVAQRQSQQIVRLVDALLDASRLSRGKLRIVRRFLDLRTLVRDGVESVRADAAGRQQQLELRIPERPVWCVGDPARLQQVVVNLVANASRYTPPHGTIEVAVDAVESHVRLTVADTGAGLDAEAREQIFQPFTQAQTSEGLGLGLAISRAIAELHDGTLSADSPGPGRGSVFTLKLPGVLERTRKVRNAVSRTREETKEVVERARLLRASMLDVANKRSGSR